MSGCVIRGLVAGAVAGVVSGAPSTAVALVSGGDPREAVRAAGTLVGSPTLAAGTMVHAAVSLWWGLVLARVLPRRRPALWGAAAGGLVAAVDLGVVGRRFPPLIGHLPALPQVADHVAFGAVAGAVLGAQSVSGCRTR